MKITKIFALFLCSICLTGLTNSIAVAEEATSNLASSTSIIISNIEKALIEVNKSEFSTAVNFVKKAREASDLISKSSENAKRAHAILNQSLIQVKSGDVEKSNIELNKALELYKSL